jgi:toxin ParE1/3/4
LKSCHDYLAAESETGSDRLIDRILTAVEMLGQHPQLGRPGRVEGTRELVITPTPFIVAYWLRGDQAQILAVLHGAGRWPEKFE